MGLASSLSLSTVAALANGQMPQTHMAHPGWQPPSGAPATHSGSPFGHFGWQGSSASSAAQAAPVPNSFAQHSAISHSSAFAAIHNPAASFQGFAGAAPASTRDLNLASPARSFVAGNLANFRELTIQIGGSQQVVTMDTKLTAAEMVAAQQILTGGNQTIKIAASGAATGGTVTINSNLLTALDTSVGGAIGSLTIARGVQVIDTLSQLTITGNLNNYGSLLTGSTTKGASDNILATTIFNAYGGAIGSYTGGGGLFAADPVLTGTNGIANAGTISSAGNLTLNAPVVYNIATTDNGATTQATISAARNVNINTQALNNAGIIAALTGNVNVASNAALSVNSAGGVFVADNGNLNFSANNSNLSMMGGDYYSKNLNLDAANATVDTFIGEVSGQVNANASCVHLNAESTSLTLGSVNATDDPIFTNKGDVVINGTITPTNGADLTLIAGGNVYGGKGNKGLDTSSKAGKGGNISVIAGAEFVNDLINPVTVTGPNALGFGGRIDLTSKSGGVAPAAVTVIKTSGSGTSDSGSVTMVAYKGTLYDGSINTSASTIDTSTKGTGKYGDVLLISGATTGTGITTGKILANNVTVASATPDAGTGVKYSQPSGTLITTNFAIGALQTSAIVLDGITAKGTVDYELNNALTINKAISAPNIIINAGATNNVTINAAVGTAATAQVDISGGTLTTTKTGVVSGVTANLKASASSIGSVPGFGSPIQYFNLKVQNVSATASNNIALQETGDLKVTNLAVGALSTANIKGSGSISQTGNFFADNIQVTASKALTLAGNVAGSNGVNGANSLALTAGTTFTQGDASGGGTLANATGFGGSITAKGAVNILGTIANTGGLDISTTSTMVVGSKTDTTASINGFFSTTSLSLVNFGNLNGSTVSITATGSGDAIINNGTIKGTGFTFLSTSSPTGAIVTNTGSVTNGGFLGLNTGKIVAHGAINGDGVQITSTKSLVIIGDNGTFTPTAGESLNISGTPGKAGDFTVTGTTPADNPFSNMSGLSDFAISFEHGTVSTPLQSMTAHSLTDGSGGTVSIFANKFVYNGSLAFNGPFVITADGSTSTVSTSRQGVQLFILGGDVNIGNDPTSITPNSVIHNFQINAAGKSDPFVFLSSAGVLRLDNPTANFITKGDTTVGNTIQVFGNLGVAINGDFSAKNKDGGYSDLQIITASKIPFVIDSPLTFPNLINGQIISGAGQGITGNAVSLNNAAGLVVGNSSGSQAVLFGNESVFSDAAKITNNATISTPQFVMLPAGGSVTITNTGTITTPTTDLDIHSLTGSLTINNSGAAIYGATGAFKVYSVAGNVTLTGGAGGAFIAPSSNSIDIEALKGTVALGIGTDSVTLNPAGPGGNGGSIIIKAIALTSAANTHLTAPTTVTGTTNAGTIDINLTGTKTLNVSQTGITLEINNQGANPGGSISVKNGGGINIGDSDSLDLTNVSPNTTNLSLISTKGPIFIYGTGAGDITLNKLDNVTISSGSSTAFLMYGAKAGANGFGTNNTDTPFQLQATTLTLINGGAIDATRTIPTANNMTLTATKGALLLGNALSPTIAAIPDATTGNGGTINVTATGLTFTDGLLINAAATGTGDGGHVNINLSGTKTINIDSGLGNMIIDISNKSAIGGSVSVTNGGNINVDASNTTLILKGTAFGTGTGANLNINAKGLLFVSQTETIAAPGYGLHNVTFASNSKTPFLVSDAAPGGKGNGLHYTHDEDLFVADSVTIINNGGSVDYNSSGPAQSKNTIQAHNISVTAAGASILFAPTFILTAQADAGGNGGSISLSSKSIPYSGGLTLDAVGTGAGAGGSISVTITDTKAIDLTSNTQLQMKVQAGATGTTGGSISLSNGGALAVSITSGSVFNYGPTVSGGGLTLKANGVLNVKNLSNLNTAGLKTLSLTSNSKNAFLMSDAAVGTNGIEGVNLGFTADNITVSNTGGALYDSSTNPISGKSSVTLNALGDIGKPAERILIDSSPNITLTTGSKGNVYVDITGTSSVLNTSVGGVLNVTAKDGDYTFGSTAAGQGIKAGSVNYIQTDTNSNNTHTLTLGNISTTNGNLTVASDAQNLTTANNSFISSNKGNIYLQDLHAPSGNLPQITFKAGTVVHGVGPASNKNQGQVFISIGPTPAINTLSSGNGPFGVATIISDPFPHGLMYFATNSNFVSGITATDKTDILTSAGRILSFSTTIPADKTHIFLETNVRITADPPMPAVPDAQTLYMAHLANPEVKQMTLSMMQPVASGNYLSMPSKSPIISVSSTSSMQANRPESVSAIRATPITNTSELLGAVSNNSVVSNTNEISNSIVLTNTCATTAVLSAGASKFGTAASIDKQTLDSGAKLLAPDVRTIINTPFGDVDIAAGAVALLVSTESGLSVYDLHDTRQGAVAIRTGNRTITLVPGRSAVLTHNSKSFAETNPAQFVGYRKIRNSAVNASHNLYEAEFEIMSMVRGLKPLQSLMTSDNAKTRKTMDKMFKTAAILMNLYSGNEPFALMKAPEVTAYAPSDR